MLRVLKPFLLIFAAVISALVAVPAQAKIVAILFDTSGSMQGRYQLPSFGARLLASTVDGRAGFDRVLVMTFDEYSKRWKESIPGVDSSMKAGSAPSLQEVISSLPTAIKDYKITNGNDHQAFVDSLQQEFRYDGNVGTPYGPIEVMLERIADEVKTGEEAVFVLVSDGGYREEFFRNGKLKSHMRRNFEAVRDRITAKGATLDVNYLFIDQLGGSNLKSLVREQGVRDTLLSVFNGDPAKGSKYVSSEAELWEALKDIVAEVSGTDRLTQSQYINYSGSTVKVDSPLSISRIVVVSTGLVGGNVPVLTNDTFAIAPTFDRKITTRMNGGDAAFGTPPARAGVVEHRWYQNAVPPGAYELTFSGPVGKDVFLLFETKAVTDLRILDEQGAEVPLDADGTHHLFIDQAYTFVGRILDGAGAPVTVEFDTLPPSLSMQLTLTSGSGPEVSSMQLDTSTDTGSFAWTPRTMGEYAAFSRASAGILSPKSETLRLTVLDTSAKLTVTDLRPTNPCPTCAPGELDAPVSVSGGGAPVAEFDVTAEARMNGQIGFSESDLPPGYEIRDPSGKPVTLNTPIDFDANATGTFTIWRTTSATPGQIAKGIQNISIVAAPTGQWGGPSAATQAKVRLDPPEMGMKLVAVTQPITPGKIDGLKVPGGELLRGAFAAQFSLTDLLEAPDPEKIDELVSISAPRGLIAPIRYTPSFADPVSTGFHALEIRPKTRFWCLCWIWGGNVVSGTDVRDVSVDFAYTVDGVTLQHAQATVPMSFPIAVYQGTMSCLLNLLYAILFYMFVRGVWALFATHRFPRGSMVEITHGSEPPRYKRLDKGNSFWWKAWFAAIFGNPDETRTIEGVKIRATHKGGIVNIAKTVPPWRLERMGATFAELKETQPKKTEHRLIWGDRLENTHDPALSMRLKRKRND